MSQPPNPPQPPWWQPPAGPGVPQTGWTPEQQAPTGPHTGQWQQSPEQAGAMGSYTGQWQQPGVTGSFSGPWQQQPGQPPAPGAPGQWQQPQAPGQWQPQQAAPETPPRGQFGGGFQPSQYGGLGAFTPEPGPKRERSKKPLIFGGIGVLVVVAGGVGAWLLGAFSGDVLDQKSVQDGVTHVLNENYGEPDVRNAACPAGESIENGTSFDCTVQIGGQSKKVTVRVLNDQAQFEVGAPH
ncbi:DUF4333 domain-containing protein [Amycolatopsis sp. H20-H5]|uniref:DUF4333 domain-containing protein n=1 Tax=Amycolatopsis sp. H20-H5 TaxID=3046309 RepID=UPI002DBB201C|nr:DUF4333 domain-containing protein [Amycolatopsis sp. H20-H5]MEC3980224.1 DUF4333 domain-containing protein [Amycolatopsis sp. H20-H5]